MKLKKTIAIVAAVFLCLTVFVQLAKLSHNSSGGFGGDSFEKMVEKADKDCPFPIAMGSGSVDGIKLEDRYLTFYLSYDTGYYNVLSKIKGTEHVDEAIIMTFLMLNAQEGNQGDVLLNALIGQGYGLKLVTSSAEGSFTCSVSSEKLSLLRSRYKLNPHEATYNLLRAMFVSVLGDFPITLDDGAIMAECLLKGTNIVFIVQVNESLYSIKQMNAHKDQIRAQLFDILCEPDAGALLGLLKISHTGLVISVVGETSGSVCEIKFSNEDICRAVKVPSQVSIK